MSNLTCKDLYGGMTALVTPMSTDGSIDYSQWRTLIDYQIKANIKAIVVAGTTGESALITNNEFEKLLKIAVDCCQSTITKVIAQTGSIRADSVIEKNGIAQKCGVDALLIVTPYYIRTTQEGLYQHFLKIANTAKLPIILYNVPTRTQIDLQVKTSALLAKHPMIIGIKEASVDPDRITQLVELLPTEFAILSGNDDTFLDSLQEGAHGVISVASNVRPVTISKICDFVALRDIISAKKLNSSLVSLFKMLSYQPNPIPVKYFMHQAGLIGDGIRLPLVWLNEEIEGCTIEQKKIIKEYSNI